MSMLNMVNGGNMWENGKKIQNQMFGGWQENLNKFLFFFFDV